MHPNIKCTMDGLPHDHCLSVTKSKDPNALFQFQRPKRRYTDPQLTPNLVFWVFPCTDPRRSAEIKLVSMVARFDLGFVLVKTQN